MDRWSYLVFVLRAKLKILALHGSKLFRKEFGVKVLSGLRHVHSWVGTGR